MNVKKTHFFYNGSSYYSTRNAIKVNEILNKKQQYTVIYQGGVGIKLYINGKLHNKNQTNSYIIPYPNANFIIGNLIHQVIVISNEQFIILWCIKSIN